MAEKSFSEVSRASRELYEKGRAALDRQNLDYAITLLNQVMQTEPAFYDCREALRAAQLRKAGGGTSFFKRMLGTASSSPLLAKGQLLLRNNPLEAIQVAEQILNNDPNNVLAHKLLADAALAADFPRTAVLSLEIALKNSPKDKDLAMRLGEALVRAGQAERAEAILTELQRAHPTDSTVAQALKNASASKTMRDGGYDALAGGEGSYRDILKDESEAVALEQEKRQVKAADIADELIRDYEARLEKEPYNLKLIRSIAELFAEKKDYDRALEYYNRVVAVEGGADPSLDRAIVEVDLKKLDQAIAALDPANPEHQSNLARLRSEKEAYYLAQCQRRAEMYPTDLQVRFDLGRAYFNAGKLSEAIQEFQKAQNNPHLRISAMSYLGQCFEKRRMFDLAARAFQNAIKEKIVFDDEKKELIYALGCVFEKMGKPGEAIEQFKQIYEVDIGFRDVAAKVDAYYAES
ncbi:MAG: tetratricopeptide repeat protein [Verrucomicrobia bacterium]|nr:tetratricopeptide repeat protein [Verrucomicrobiota bacterium]